MKLKTLMISLGALVAAGATAGVVFAVWSASGSGTGAGGAITAQTLTVTAVTPGPSGSSLYPGGPAGWVYLTVKNPNPYPITITGYSWGTPVSTDTANCPSANISLDANAPTTASISVAANTTSGALQIVNVLDLAHSAPNGCQGVAFNVPVTVTGVQQ